MLCSLRLNRTKLGEFSSFLFEKDFAVHSKSHGNVFVGGGGWRLGGKEIIKPKRKICLFCYIFGIEPNYIQHKGLTLNLSTGSDTIRFIILSC